jgi:hypothetical protein
MITALYGDVDKRLEHLITSRLRLEWAVDYVDLDLSRLPLWRVEELRIDLRNFIGFTIGVTSGENEYVTLPSDGDMRDTQTSLRSFIAAAIAHESTEVGTYHAQLRLVYMPRPATGPADVDVERPLKPYLFEEGKHEMPVPDLARWQLARDVIEQERLGVTFKSCPGPVPHRRGRLCGRWFVGPAKKQYCSPECRTRAIDQRRRPLRQPRGV